MPRRRADGAPAGRHAGRGAGGVRPPVRARQPRALRRAGRPSGSARPARGRVDAALDQVGLAGSTNGRCAAYSLGMRQRLGLAAALLRPPRLLVLDEPTNGLDPQGIREMRDLLLDLNAAGTTIFLSSHLLAEVEQLCTRVGVLDRGRLVRAGASSPRSGGRPAASWCAPRTSPRAVALLDGRVESHDGDRLLVRVADAGRAQRPPRRGRSPGQRARRRAARRWSRSCSRPRRGCDR